MTVEEHFAALREIERRDHEEFVAMIQGWLSEAVAAGDEVSARRHREHLTRLEAIPKPWEPQQRAA
ncbi:hypothetical protein F4553_007250 [Allocatelliglobosispora scoriae]|uniref:Uncharacterized protein n=1 Tax=Allocatelliglobosispora scoriae TaxID=643052 RepID=A0A841C1R6_9ACTN|nr:hypothetical protein [Allocatelliglobosispora scoriae]MBB5873816.1 hypothetical protein [Allocatelliglobosispora scoriae]